MDLPTYTNIWRIEKRLYKLYDVRLPMPLPINWIAVFAGITIPYIVLLIAIGLPFNHDLVWLYVLPPGVLTWLTTRPVLEGKRLPELVESQTRYLAEPRTWVRLTPLSEKDQMVLTARVWRSNRPAKQPATAPRSVPVTRPALPAAQPGRQVGTLRPEPVLRPTSVFRPEPASRTPQQQSQQPIPWPGACPRPGTVPGFRVWAKPGTRPGPARPSAAALAPVPDTGSRRVAARSRDARPVPAQAGPRDAGCGSAGRRPAPAFYARRSPAAGSGDADARTRAGDAAGAAGHADPRARTGTRGGGTEPGSVA